MKDVTWKDAPDVNRDLFHVVVRKDRAEKGFITRLLQKYLDSTI